MLSKKEVLHIAKLCNLSLSEEEIERLAEMLGETIDYINILEELDTENVEETYQVTGVTNVFQNEAEKETTLTQENSLKNARAVNKKMFTAKAVFKR